MNLVRDSESTEGDCDSHIACRHGEAIPIGHVLNLHLCAILCRDGNLVNSIAIGWFRVNFNKVAHKARIHADVEATILSLSFGNIKHLP